LTICTYKHIVDDMNHDEATARARILKAMSHPARVILVDALSRGDRCVCELLPLLGLDQSVVSRHLAHLKQAGIVTERKDGVRVIHHLECPCILKALECTLGVLRRDAQRRSRVLKAGGA
jgi:DNA-binding transcriptional ArsR family regulator